MTPTGESLQQAFDRQYDEVLDKLRGLGVNSPSDEFHSLLHQLINMHTFHPYNPNPTKKMLEDQIELMQKELRDIRKSESDLKIQLISWQNLSHDKNVTITALEKKIRELNADVYNLTRTNEYLKFRAEHAEHMWNALKDVGHR